MSVGVVQIVGWVLSMWIIVRPLGGAWARRAETQTALSGTELLALMAVFGALVPERVAHGLTATGHSWIDCFLARATAAPPPRVPQPLGRGLAGRRPWARVRRLAAGGSRGRPSVGLKGRGSPDPRGRMAGAGRDACCPRLRLADGRVRFVVRAPHPSCTRPALSGGSE